ncbi:protein tyrosine phosphatase family protein (plasmid) [Kovacikia minuta CCNUW1]|uniref:beta-lactamase hydrolase domain-containing protein n=1 Tax=Kovacikia minuta TaxID=2931930 RepID=UPI001CC90C6D|nr:protein tyrosine phosphatase family protein [Kovacikia minuta]UBF30316.1 protein tyrosine phosphatase family protein [Kovacikia minuta CCNUW1]
MEAKKVSEDLSVAGQPSPEDLQQAPKIGFKSVLNLRSPGETNSLPDEQQHAESAGLKYAHVWLNSSVADEVLVNQALETLEDLPKPVLVHCGAGLRAGAIALIATAKAENWTLEQLTQQAAAIGLQPEQPQLQQFIQQTYGKSER